MRDVVYYYKKDKTGKTQKRFELGEIQKDFNLSFVLDGTKDSARISVIGFNEEEIEPNTIIKHEATNNFFIVKHDKVERYKYENNFLYKHNLQLLGAIDLLNARDMTDCGFYNRKYTVEQFIRRIVKLSSIEYQNNYDIFTDGGIDLEKVVDYIKTYENYTPLSALREFLDGYNYTCKLYFTEVVYEDSFRINNAIIYLVSKTGDKLSPRLNENIFSDVRETKTMDKNSFGTTVISNAENVVSTKSKTFPSVGWARLSGSQRIITPANAELVLPSNINKINWIKIRKNYNKVLCAVRGNNQGQNISTIFDVVNDKSFENQFYTLVETIKGLGFISDAIKQQMETWLYQNRDSIKTTIQTASTITLKSGWNVNAYTGARIAPTNDSDFYFPVIAQIGTGAIFTDALSVGTQEDRNYYTQPLTVITYEKGKNVIKGFDFLSSNLHDYIGTGDYRTHIVSYGTTDIQNASYNNAQFLIKYFGEFSIEFLLENVTYTEDYQEQNVMNLNTSNVSIKVNYVPASDIKIKLDNDADRLDTQLYNQNGKLNDSVSLSKLMLSYAKEIQSDTITKYADFYNYDNVPKVGRIVDINGQPYVINNVSLDITQNESSANNDIGYYISGEFTMSKYVATKSLMTSPNQNIRDYGIPQNNNVARKQVYRDFYEFSHTADTQADENYYLTLDKVWNFTTTPSDYSEHTAIIEIEFNNGDYWYYQLETTTYTLKKSLYEVVNFPDNNIIGYDSQNQYSGFDISRILTGLANQYSTPISYVDENGEFKNINIAFVDKTILQDIYDKYQTEKGTLVSLINFSVFIDSEIYNGVQSYPIYENIGDFEIRKIDYFAYSRGFEIVLDAVIPADITEPLQFVDLQVKDEFGTEYSVDTQEITQGYLGNRYVAFIKIDSLDYISERVWIFNFGLNKVIKRGAKTLCDFEIKEPNYNKDPLEVPVFEYCCQIDDSEVVLIGENILDTKATDKHYFYSCYWVDKNTIDDNNWGHIDTAKRIYFVDDDMTDNLILERYSGESDGGVPVKISKNDNKLEIELFETAEIEQDTQNTSYGVSVGIETDLEYYQRLLENTDMVIVRHKIVEGAEIKIDGTTPYYETENDLIMVVRDLKNADISGNKLSLIINHYNLK